MLELLDGHVPDPFPHLAFLHPHVGLFCRLFHAEPAPVPRLASDAARGEPFWLVDSMRMYRFFYDHARRQLRRMAPDLFAITYRNRACRVPPQHRGAGWADRHIPMAIFLEA